MAGQKRNKRLGEARKRTEPTKTKPVKPKRIWCDNDARAPEPPRYDHRGQRID